MDAGLSAHVTTIVHLVGMSAAGGVVINQPAFCLVAAGFRDRGAVSNSRWRRHYVTMTLTSQ